MWVLLGARVWGPPPFLNKGPCWGAMWIFWPDIWVEFWMMNLGSRISWGWIFQGASSAGKKNRIKKFDPRLRVRKSGVQNFFPEFGPKFGFRRCKIPCAEICPWQFQEKCSRSEKAILGALGLRELNSRVFPKQLLQLWNWFSVLKLHARIGISQLEHQSPPKGQKIGAARKLWQCHYLDSNLVSKRPCHDATTQHESRTSWWGLVNTAATQSICNPTDKFLHQNGGLRQHVTHQRVRDARPRSDTYVFIHAPASTFVRPSAFWLLTGFTTAGCTLVPWHMSRA